MNRKRSIDSGLVRSCGCQVAEVARIRMTGRSHGLSKTRPYYQWENIVGRCTRTKNVAYKDYGGRGITICERWMKFENFYEDMGEKPEGKSIDRIDNNKGYSPENCRWATLTEQMRNRRNNRMIEICGIKKCLSEWCETLNIEHNEMQRMYKIKSNNKVAKIFMKNHEEELALVLKRAYDKDKLRMIENFL